MLQHRIIHSKQVDPQQQRRIILMNKIMYVHMIWHVHMICTYIHTYTKEKKHIKPVRLCSSLFPVVQGSLLRTRYICTRSFKIQTVIWSKYVSTSIHHPCNQPDLLSRCWPIGEVRPGLWVTPPVQIAEPGTDSLLRIGLISLSPSYI